MSKDTRHHHHPHHHLHHLPVQRQRQLQVIANARAALVTTARLLSLATLTQALRRHVRLMRVAQLSHPVVQHQEALDL